MKLISSSNKPIQYYINGLGQLLLLPMQGGAEARVIHAVVFVSTSIECCGRMEFCSEDGRTLSLSLWPFCDRRIARPERSEKRSGTKGQKTPVMMMGVQPSPPALSPLPDVDGRNTFEMTRLCTPSTLLFSQSNSSEYMIQHEDSTSSVS
jgi:hypothetical protein